MRVRARLTAQMAVLVPTMKFIRSSPAFEPKILLASVICLQKTGSETDFRLKIKTGY